jgi:hypothetical protein
MDSGVRSCRQSYHQGCQAYLIDILVVDLDHGCVHTCAEALDLRHGEQAVLAGAVHLDPSVVLDGLDYVSGAPELARSGPAHLQVVLPDAGPIEHRVE